MASNFSNRATLLTVAGIEIALMIVGCDTAGTPRPPVEVADTNAHSSQEKIRRSIPTDAIKVLKIRIVSFANSKGVRSKMVLVTWKNVGNRTVRAIDAQINLVNSNGRVMDTIPKYAIYAVPDESAGVPPGETFDPPDDHGYVIDPSVAQSIQYARVKVIEVVEFGAF